MFKYIKRFHLKRERGWVLFWLMANFIECQLILNAFNVLIKEVEWRELDVSISNVSKMAFCLS